MAPDCSLGPLSVPCIVDLGAPDTQPGSKSQRMGFGPGNKRPHVQERRGALLRTPLGETFAQTPAGLPSLALLGSACDGPTLDGPAH